MEGRYFLYYEKWSWNGWNKFYVYLDVIVESLQTIARTCGRSLLRIWSSRKFSKRKIEHVENFRNEIICDCVNRHPEHQMCLWRFILCHLRNRQLVICDALNVVYFHLVYYHRSLRRTHCLCAAQFIDCTLEMVLCSNVMILVVSTNLS